MRDAPKLLDRLSPTTTPSTSRACASCSTTPDLRYELDPTLVRGLDYYTRTVFEFTSDALGAQSGVGGGGRYDGLIEQLGGRPTPGVGLGGRGRADPAGGHRAADRAATSCDLFVAVADATPAAAGAAARVRHRQRGAPRRAERAARAGRPVAQGPAQARRPARRPLRCDRRRRARRSPQAHGVRRPERASSATP